ncbi:hypothetical protein D3C72_1646810 [compost metagenome]
MIAHHPVAPIQALIQHGQQAPGLGRVAVARTLVFVVLARELMEEAELAEHRADAAHLEHHPLQRLVASRRVGRDELAGLAGQVDQDGAGFKQGQRRAVGPVGVEDGRNLVVRADRQEFG